MTSGYSKSIKLIHFLGDILFVNISFVLCYYYQFSNFNILGDDFDYLLLLVRYNLLWIIIVLVLDIYHINRTTHIQVITANMIKAIFFHFLVNLALINLLKQFYFPQAFLIHTYVVCGAFITFWRFLVLWQLKQYRKRGYNYRNVILIGTGFMAEEVYLFVKKNINLGYRITGAFDDEIGNVIFNSIYKGKLDEIKKYCLENKVDELFIALPSEKGNVITDLIRFAENNLIRIKIVPPFSGFVPKKVKIDFWDNTPILLIRKEPLEIFTNRLLKSLFDIVFALVVIVLIFPWFFPIMALIIKLSSPGPVFFVQKRTGKNDKMFRCLKFRTMRVNNEADELQATMNDVRLTSIGSFLRRYNIDEFPQFLNVLKGDMSVVGPRPHMLKHTDDYSVLIDKYMVRHFIKPGITGWAQVLGFRGGTETIDQMEKRVKADIWYIENWSFLLDLKIILLTILSVFRGEKNAY